ncbi:unnamed protein product, partial [Rotaria magnacalcarata]
DAEKAKFQGESKAVDQYGERPGQDHLEKEELKSLSVDTAKKPAAEDDDDIDLFGDENEEE